MTILRSEGPKLHVVAAPAVSVPLPCLSSNNSNERAPQDPKNVLSSQHRKTASALAWNVQALSEKHGIGRVGFLTLTFADHVLDPREAQKRFNSLRAGILADRYVAWVRVLERQKSGRIHYHLLIVLRHDIREGFDFTGADSGVYSSASPALRSEWAFWRQTAKLYGFGRTELLPVRSTHEGIARYVGKYISKHIGQREERDKGIRLAEYSRGGRIANTKFAWATPGASEWRAKVALFAAITGERLGVVDGFEYEDLKRTLGPRWAYWHWDFIASLPIAGEVQTCVPACAG